jgi:hypothetical protein
MSHTVLRLLEQLAVCVANLLAERQRRKSYLSPFMSVRKSALGCLDDRK